jgi:hypothetical protein
VPSNYDEFPFVDTGLGADVCLRGTNEFGQMATQFRIASALVSFELRVAEARLSMLGVFKSGRP